MDVAALIVSIFAILVACVSVYFARQQATAANTQAEASKVQADAAKVSADASRIQAAAATEALKQAASWRAEEERRGEPQFRVTARPTLRIQRDGQFLPSGESYLGSVHVVVENTSSRDATINHAGIEDFTGSEHILGAHDLGIEFPHRLLAGHQIEFSVSGDYFFGFLGDAADGLPEESEFVVFVAKSSFLSDGSAVERWDSRPFIVRLPSSHGPTNS